jgi:hypothetical protein
MSEKLCIFCKHFRWEEEPMWGMGSTLTGPMMVGGDATCAAGQFEGKWDNRPRDEVDWRQIILRGEDCPKYECVYEPGAAPSAAE